MPVMLEARTLERPHGLLEALSQRALLGGLGLLLRGRGHQLLCDGPVLPQCTQRSDHLHQQVGAHHRQRELTERKLSLGASINPHRDFVEDFAAPAEAEAFLKKWQSVTSWTYQDVGAAKKNPADLGIAKP